MRRLIEEAEALAERVDTFRDALVTADVDEDTLRLWREAAVVTWDAYHALNEWDVEQGGGSDP